MKNQTEEDARTLGSKLLNVPADNLKIKSLENEQGYYVWQPIRGGSALMIANDGSVLFANSSLTFEEHLQAFRNGQRTDKGKF